jgi:hypothetical protein
MRSENGYTIEDDCIKAFGKKYKILFKSESVDAVNQYCTDNNNCGIIDTIDNIHYVCSFNEKK